HCNPPPIVFISARYSSRNFLPNLTSRTPWCRHLCKQPPTGEERSLTIVCWSKPAPDLGHRTSARTTWGRLPSAGRAKLDRQNQPRISEDPLLALIPENPRES